MSHLIFDKRDWNFILNEQLNVAQLTQWEAFADFDEETLQAIVDEGVKFAIEQIAPTNEPGDRTGCIVENGSVRVPKEFHPVYKAHCNAGWLGLIHKADFGGQGVPLTINAAVSEATFGANMAFAMYGALTHSAGHLIENFGSEELKNTFVENMYAGKWGGTMGLTEPQAGSEVGDLRTKATRNDDGTFNIEGNKIFISGGDSDLVENIVHLVLARIEGDPAGTKGISLFVVPKYRVNADGSVGESNNVSLVGIEHKLGINGSATCSLAFGDGGPSVGYLVGEERSGMMYMFQMMNEARIACGQQGVSQANAAYQRTLAYARERAQGADMDKRDGISAPIIVHADVRRNLMFMRAFSEGTRALTGQAAFWADQAHHAPTAEERAAAQDLLELSVPVVKAYSTDKAFKVCELALQIYGGSGFLKDHPVEQYLRDTKITSIYEGTNGIQAMDLVGRKLRMRGGALLMGYLGQVGTFVAENKGREELADVIATLERVQGSVGQAAMWLAQTAPQDIKLAMLQATPFLEILGDLMVGHQLAIQATIAADALKARIGHTNPSIEEREEDADIRFYAGKLDTARFFAAEVTALAPSKVKVMTSGTRAALDTVF